MLISVRLFVHSVQVCLEISIFNLLAQATPSALSQLPISEHTLSDRGSLKYFILFVCTAVNREPDLSSINRLPPAEDAGAAGAVGLLRPLQPRLQRLHSSAGPSAPLGCLLPPTVAVVTCRGQNNLLIEMAWYEEKQIFYFG